MKKGIVRLIALLMLLAAFVGVLGSCGMKDEYYVEMKVEDFGTIVLKLDTLAAPETVKNFVSLVKDKYYDGATFHRIIENFMIQGGGKEGAPEIRPIKGEFAANGYQNPLIHERGTISMARADDPDSATSQFFICNADSPHLDGYYAAFGYVISGMDVVDAITEYGVQYTFNGIIYNQSLRPTIESVRLISKP